MRYSSESSEPKSTFRKAIPKVVLALLGVAAGYAYSDYRSNEESDKHKVDIQQLFNDADIDPALSRVYNNMQELFPGRTAEFYGGLHDALGQLCLRTGSRNGRAEDFISRKPSPTYDDPDFVAGFDLIYNNELSPDPSVDEFILGNVGPYCGTVARSYLEYKINIILNDGFIEEQ